MTKIIVVGIMILLMVVSFSGCNESNNSLKTDEDRITGTWFVEIDEGGLNPEGGLRTLTYIFSSDKSYEVIGTFDDHTESFNGTWELVDNKLIITIEGESQTGNYQFSNNDKTLTITDAVSKNITVLTKQE